MTAYTTTPVKEFVGGNAVCSKDDAFIQRYADRFCITVDKDCSIRENKLHLLQMFLDKSIYDNLAPFHEEYTSGQSGKYIKLNKRRPSVLYGLCKIVVDDSVGMLFGEGHFPRIECKKKDSKILDFLNYITDECNLKNTMINAARIGSIGSVAIVVKILEGKFYFDVLNSKNLTPVFDRMRPNKLKALLYRRKVDGSTLETEGYIIEEKFKNRYYWLEVEWTETDEIYYHPYLCEKEISGSYKERDEERSSNHDLGFVPIVWIQNLPKAHHPDGECTFEAAVDASIEIDYQLSQLGRGLYYNSDPTLVVKNPTSIEGNQFVKNTTILNLDEKGDAFYAEINGNAAAAVIDYVKHLRDFALETCRGNRTSPDKLNAVQSGKAMRMLNNSLVLLVSELRLSYGDFGLLQIYKMCLDIYFSDKYEIDVKGNEKIEKDSDELFLIWPEWYPVTGQDKYHESQALSLYRQSGLISQKTAMESIAEEYNIKNVDEEIVEVDKEKPKEQNSGNGSANVDRKPTGSSGA